ncbi:MAG TPA: hypothetical protein VF771_10455, partial [Longimicrobiaceae bacterium]
ASNRATTGRPMVPVAPMTRTRLIWFTGRRSKRENGARKPAPEQTERKPGHREWRDATAVISKRQFHCRRELIEKHNQTWSMEPPDA